MNKLVNLEKKEFDKFVLSSKNPHFMQSYDFGKIREFKGVKAHYLGLKDKNKIKCAALLLEKILPLGYSYLYSPCGYAIDFNDMDLLKEFNNELKKYFPKAIFIKIDPPIKLHNLDIEGNVIEGEDHTKLVEDLKSLGFKHLGFNKLFEHEQPRYTFKLHLDGSWDDIYKRMHPTTKKILNKGNQYDFDIIKGNSKDIDDFYKTMIDVSKREGIIQAPKEYYKLFFETFNQDGMSDLYIVKANTKKLKKIFKDKIKTLEEEIDKLKDENKYKNRDKALKKSKDLENQKAKLNKTLNEIKSIKEDTIVLSSIITVKYDDTVFTVHGGNSSTLMELNANYLCYYTIIKDAFDEGYKIVDFFGTCGDANPSKDNPVYGIHNFKKRLGGEFVEFIGEFDYVAKPFMYFVFTKLVPLYRKLKRKKTRKDFESEINRD